MKRHLHATADEIGSRLFAVHGTKMLPWDGRLRAGTGRSRITFRPGAHFSLGALSPPMDDDQSYRFAIVAPLRCLTPQLLNVSPVDTFVLGDLPLSRETTVIVPAGMEMPPLPADVPVRTYAHEGLRSAVLTSIEELHGWVVDLPDDFDIDSRATVDGVNIQTAGFFAPFLSAHPHVAFGGHAASEIGDAGLFGMVDRLIQGLTRRYVDHPSAVCFGKTRFVVACIEHYLARLDRLLVALKYPPAALAVYDAIKRSVVDQLHVIQVELRSCERSLGPCDSRGALFAAEVLSVLPSEELHELRRSRPEALAAIPWPETLLAYCALRWLTIRTAAARRERLDMLLPTAVGACEAEAIGLVLEILLAKSRSCSSRRHDALEILSIPALGAYRGRDLRDSSLLEESTVYFKNSGRYPCILQCFACDACPAGRTQAD